jgi:hypothetical protein
MYNTLLNTNYYHLYNTTTTYMYYTPHINRRSIADLAGSILQAQLHLRGGHRQEILCYYVICYMSYVVCRMSYVF